MFQSLPVLRCVCRSAIKPMAVRRLTVRSLHTQTPLRLRENCRPSPGGIRPRNQRPDTVVPDVSRVLPQCRLPPARARPAPSDDRTPAGPRCGCGARPGTGGPRPPPPSAWTSSSREHQAARVGNFRPSWVTCLSLGQSPGRGAAVGPAHTYAHPFGQPRPEVGEAGG